MSPDEFGLAVQQAAAGNEEAFSELVSSYHQELLRVAYIVLGDTSLAEDAAQSAWVNAWRNLKRLRDPNKVRVWLLAIAANEARQMARRNRRIGMYAQPGATAAPADPALTDLASALRRLDEDERRLLSLRFVAGLTSGEIAEALGVSANAVRHRLMRLLHRLRRELGDE